MEKERGLSVILRKSLEASETIPETASRLRNRIERVLDAARAKGQRTGENPARWRGHLDKLLPARQKLTRGHHAALPYQNVPAFIGRLREREAVAAQSLEFTILTAARSGEVLGMKWGEIDLNEKVWRVPPERMKAGREHRVPLAPRALAILETLKAVRTSDYVFAGATAGRPLSFMALAMVLRRMSAGVTTHGFRSSFRDWCGEATSFPREIAEAALAHVVQHWRTEDPFYRSQLREWFLENLRNDIKNLDASYFVDPADLSEAKDRTRRMEEIVTDMVRFLKKDWPAEVGVKSFIDGMVYSTPLSLAIHLSEHHCVPAEMVKERLGHLSPLPLYCTAQSSEDIAWRPIVKVPEDWVPGPANPFAFKPRKDKK